VEAAQLADLHSCIHRQIYQQMVNAGGHSDVELRAISANTEG
jgi:hypothetical protein